MAVISKIKPGQILYDVKRTSGFNAFRRKWDVWPVLVDDVNLEEGYIIARWNVVNPPEKMHKFTFKRFRYKDPR